MVKACNSTGAAVATAAQAIQVAAALPVDRFRTAGDGCEAMGVVIAGPAFAFEPRPADAALAAAPAHARARLASD